jgi:two-component system invasion response regulator UvrY
MSALKVALVDDHALFRTGVRTALLASDEWQIVGEAGSAREAFELVDRTHPDIVLMDIALQDADGVSATREITRRSSKSRVLILSLYDELVDVLDALNAGASGYALKCEPVPALENALRTVARGHRYLAAAVASRLAAYESRRCRSGDLLDVLSERERQVFRLAAECLLTREIARELSISPKTVGTHLYRIHRKLALRNTTELVRLAAALGLTRYPRSRWRAVAAQAGETGVDAAAPAL